MKWALLYATSPSTPRSTLRPRKRSCGSMNTRVTTHSEPLIAFSENSVGKMAAQADSDVIALRPRCDCGRGNEELVLQSYSHPGQTDRRFPLSIRIAPRSRTVRDHRAYFRRRFCDPSSSLANGGPQLPASYVSTGAAHLSGDSHSSSTGSRKAQHDST